MSTTTMAPGPTPTVIGPPESRLSYMMTPRSTRSITHTKGLLNMPGQNNCFLNSAVQVLWHLDIFRRSFREITSHACMAESCIFCALKELFTQFQYSQESALPPDALRRALAETFFDQRRFQLGFMDDAAECFENILLRIHFHIANQETEDMCCAAHCIPHQKFAMTLVEQTVCHACGATSEPLPFTQMVHYVSASALSSQANILAAQVDCQDYFGELLKRAGGMGDIRECPSSCGAKVHIRRTLINHPEIVSIGLVWDSERPTLDHIMDVFHAIGTTVKLQDIFHSVVDSRWAATATHQLVGIVTYYGKHYSTFFFHTKLRVWIYFDDAAVREIGPCWEQVIDKCRRGHFQPLLLLYANPNGQPISLKSSAEPMTPVQEQKKFPEDTSMTNPQKLGELLKGEFQQAPHLEGLLKNGPVLTRSTTPNFGLGRKGCDDIDKMVDGHWIHDHKDNKNHDNPGSFHNLCDGRCLRDCQNIGTSRGCGASGQTEESVRCKISDTTVTSSEILSCTNATSSSCKPTRPASLDDLLYTLNKQDKVVSESLESHKGCTRQAEIKQTQDCFDGGDNESTYISRKAVESVLNFQKLQRQRSLSGTYSSGSVGNRNSSSSLESFENAIYTRDKINGIRHALKQDLPDGIASHLKRRDSGNWSGDRNSASSSSSTSLDNPFPFTLGNRRLFSAVSSQKQGSSNATQMSHDYMNVTALPDQGYDSFSLSSTDSFPSPMKLEPRLTQIPENLQSVVSADENRTMSGIKSKGETTIGPKEDCDKLCAEADILLTCSYEKEKGGDLVMAALLSDSAAAKARAAMDAPYSNPQSLISAKMKHSLCVMRSSNLHRKLKEANAEEKRKQKEAAGEGHHSRQSSRDSSHGRHSRQGSKDGKEHGKHATTLESGFEKIGNSIEIYATLPKKMGKKKSQLTNTPSLCIEDDQLYKDFIEKQKKNGLEASNLKLNAVKTAQKVETDKVKSSIVGNGKWSKASENVQGTNGVKNQGLVQRSLPSPCLFQDSDFNELNQKMETTKKITLCRTHSVSSALKPEYGDGQNATLANHGGKKQHRIRRKLMGGLMRRKNRSLPDLREGQQTSDMLSRSFDDTIVVPPINTSQPSTPRMAKKEPPGVCANQTRGFHQPHRAFINKNIYQRPLLMKVNPPNIDGPQTKPKCPPPKLLPMDVAASNKNNKDDAAVLSYILHSPNPDLPSKPSSYKMPPTVTTGTCEALPTEPTKQRFDYDMVALADPVTIPENKDKVPEEPFTLAPTETTTCPGSSGFLAELQSKRRETTDPSPALGSKADSGGLNKNKTTTQSGSVWLQELQNKQLQMLQRRQQPIPDEQTPHFSQDIKSQVLQNAASNFNRSQSENTETIQQQINTNLKDSKVALPRAKDSMVSNEANADKPSFVDQQILNNGGDVVDGVKPRSVKDLASRFEQILKPPTAAKDPPTLHNRNTASCVSAHSQNLLAEKPQLSYPPSHKTIPSANQLSHVEEKCFALRIQNSEKADGPVQANVRDLTNQQAVPSVQYLKQDLGPHRNSEFATNQLSSASSQAVCRDDQHKGDSKIIRSLSPLVQTTNFNNGQQDHCLPSYPINNGERLEMRRPDRPPDYETAIQRLGMIRDRSNCGTPVDGTLLGKQDAPQVMSSTQLAEMSKKKRGPKKTVTFSDQVVLVACADDDDTEFLPNPLLERVYKQHLMQQCGSEEESRPVSKDVPLYPSDIESCCEQSFNPQRTNVQREVPQSVPCHLCNKKNVTPPTVYCPDCAFYMSRFQPRH